MVFYRKYRPQKISELDSKDLQDRLCSVLSGKTVPHAFLFTGSKGLGKTSTARIVAKAINCEKKSKGKSQSSKVQVKTQNEELEPCNECSQCTSITNGSNLDVLEIDGASNRGIDEVRDLREKINLLPVSDGKKIYIIDEVHMLTTEAFNALLKTLEEPPAHAMFIFCTTEAHKVPSTIASRCFQVSFHVATTDELVHSFRRIAKGESLKIDKEVFEEIAKLSDGSFRDGAKILEEMVLQSGGGEITKELLEKKYHVASGKYYVDELLEHIKNKDTKSSLLVIRKLNEKGIDVKYFLEQTIEQLHVQLLVKTGVEKESRIQNLDLRIEEIKKLVELFAKAYQELKYAVLPQLPLELAIIEWGIVATPVIVSEQSEHGNLKIASSQAPRNDTVGDNDLWGQLIDKVKSHNHSLAGVLRGCQLKSLDNDKLVIETSFKFHKDRLSEDKAMEVLKQVATQISGNPVEVLIELKGR